MRALNDAGVPCYVAIAPVVPQITDHELEHIIEAAVEAGAPGGFYLPVRLPHEVAPLFRAWLEAHYPDRAAKVMATIHALRGGRDNDPNFFSRMRGAGPMGRVAAHAGSRSLARNMVCSQRRNSRFVPTCFASASKATRCAFFDRFRQPIFWCLAWRCRSRREIPAQTSALQKHSPVPCRNPWREACRPERPSPPLRRRSRSPRL